MNKLIAINVSKLVFAQRALAVLSEKKHTVLIYILAHSGIPGNEKADELYKYKHDKR